MTYLQDGLDLWTNAKAASEAAEAVEKTMSKILKNDASWVEQQILIFQSLARKYIST